MAEPLPLITANELRLTIGHQEILRGVSLVVRERERVGLVGRNGTGKSSLLRILAGISPPDGGEVVVQPRMQIGYLPQEFALDDSVSIRDNIRQGARHILELLRDYERPGLPAHRHAEIEHRLNVLDGWNLDLRIDTLASHLSLPPFEREIASLSGGERRRVALAQALVGNPDLLILDEPTNHLDIAAIEWLETYLGRYPGALLLVTHDRFFLDRLCTRLFDLTFGQVYATEGNYTAYLRAKADRLARSASAEEKRQSFLAREYEWVRRGPKARTTKAIGRLKRYYAAAGQDAPEEEGEVELLLPPADYLGTRILDFEGVGCDLGGRNLFRGFSFSVAAGMRLGIVGPNGAGKTTFLNLILGNRQPTAGAIRIGESTRFNYIDQQRLLQENDKSVFEEVGEGRDFVMLGARKIQLWSYLKRFLFEDERIRTPVGQLSGGERNRVLLAKMLKYGGNFLLLDEPTNDLDLETLRVIEEALQEFDGCAMVVSHDRYFLNRVCTGLLVFDGEGGIEYQEGDYDYYLQKRAERERVAQAAAAAQTPPPPPPTAKPRGAVRGLSWKEERELAAVETRIGELERTIAELEKTFSAPDFYAKHGARAAQLADELAEHRNTLAQCFERWAELEEKR